MRRFILCIVLGNVLFISYARKITGTITDSAGTILPYASIQVKGTQLGTTANSEGRYALDLDEGSYTIICQHINYTKSEKSVIVAAEDLTVDFSLTPQQFTMEAVIIRKGADPAEQIMRNTIARRQQHQDETGSFTCQVYTKGNLRVRSMPDKVMGRKVELQDDFKANKILFLSETIANYAVDGKGRERIDVVATKVSGISSGYGLSTPQVISFYDNIVKVGENLNPRGFISPVSDNAFNFYRYKFEGMFYEDGRQISRIRVIPRRKYEPVFSGYINIIEEEWRIHSLSLQLTQQSQMQLVDTLVIDQLYMPEGNAWVVKNQVVYPSIKLFGFESHGSFVNVYSGYALNPAFPRKFFDKTVLKYTDSSNRKSQEFWTMARPVELLPDEQLDYHRKDSIERAHNDPEYLDSLDRMRNRVTPLNLVLGGQTFYNREKRVTLTFPSVIETASYNTVEGLVIHYAPVFTRRLDTSITGRREVTISPILRYGFTNNHFNPALKFGYRYGRKYPGTISLQGGSGVFQFNNENPISPIANTVSTLVFGKNHMKIYEARYLTGNWSQEVASGLTVSLGMQFQDRMPLENMADHTFSKSGTTRFTANFPTEISEENIYPHQAAVASAGIRWQPGSRYVEFPDRRISVGSRFPVFHGSLSKGINKLFGSDVDYTKWEAGVSDNLNMQLAGTFRYNISAGGFLQQDAVQLPDYTHFNGNQLFMAAPYLNSFQLAPYYRYSNTNAVYFTGHAEHHFNGFLTNKIPLFRKLNWNLVAGNNTFFVNTDNYYTEVFIGLENIFRIFRFDLINSYEKGQPVRAGFRIGMNGALFSK